MPHYLGEIRLFAGPFVPIDWHACDGSLLKIAQFPNLYYVIQTRFGGDGHSTYGLPDLRGRLPIGRGQGEGLSPRALGQMGGSSTVTLTRQELPAHNHAFMTAGADVTTPIFSDAVTFGNMKPPSVQYLKNAAFGSVGKQYPSDRTISDSGGSKSHDNTMPSMTLNYIIALEGHYPQF